ncbi:Clavaminate synthase-like protein [Neolentinus lepideus HHB14362 ss-1]|uniref:Clavaminate synthase-like protein n=1 Tax=Neolentinus lepideus HHB14362 ss-1 TaxID=1314782 RepID=A0A165T1U3_9AGAM|nr:Clavaminate synthase-like protein [Neolentinus lepideus HHB14362 ss-1]
MPSRTLPPVEPYTPAPPPTEDLDYADLPVIDLSKTTTLEGRAKLAAVARDAMRNYGFLYAINHGYTPSETKRMFDIANVPFEHVSNEEKQTYAGNIKATGSYQGYKLRNYWHIDNGVHDQLEHYNINRDVTKKQHPQALRPLLPEIEAFAKHCHSNVLHPILRLLAIGLEMPEDALVNIHNYYAKGETYVRFMKYYPRSEEEEEKTNNVWLKGHTDFGSITVLWSQAVAALQILLPDGKWRWVKHVENALVINVADALEFLSGGFYKATIHRVVQPPPSQRGYTRLGLFYFAMPDDDVVLAPLEKVSPVIQREGVQLDGRFGDGEAPTMEVWRRGRTSAYGKSELKKDESGADVEVINGVVVKHYN